MHCSLSSAVLRNCTISKMTDVTDLENILPGRITKKWFLISYSSEPLTAAGDNYGSEMLLLKLTLQDKNSKEKSDFTMVAKKNPENEFIQKLFNIPLTFRKEVEFYRDVLPTLKKFEQENFGHNLLNFFPEYYGARLSMDPNSKTVDKNAILLLENLKLRDFQNENRSVGFDLVTSKVILDRLAILHGIALAFKIKRSKEFEEIIKPILKYPFGKIPLDEGEQKILLMDILNAGISADINLKKIADDIYSKLERSLKIRYSPKEPNELFATICHNDFWVNNIMIKKNNGTITECKFLDFQFTQYGSPAKDVIFFILTSIKQDIIETYFDNLLENYYVKFLETLRNFKCDTQAFSYSLFRKEIQRVIQEDEFYHIMVMLKPIFATKGTVKEVKNLDVENILSKDAESDFYKERVAFTINELYNRKLL